MENELNKLMKLIGSHGTEEQAYAVSMAFHAARIQIRDEEKFKTEFGTFGFEIMSKFVK